MKAVMGKTIVGCVAAMAAMSVGACGGGTPVSLAGKWEGTVTCYKVESPLAVTIDAATPKEATVSMGDGGALSWKAAVTVDEGTRAVSITSDGKMDDAHLLAGTLSADGSAITGNMEKQLCTSFGLARKS